MKLNCFIFWGLSLRIGTMRRPPSPSSLKVFLRRTTKPPSLPSQASPPQPDYIPQANSVMGIPLNVGRYPYSWGQLSSLTLPQRRTGRSCGLMSYEGNITRNNGTSLRTLWRSKTMVRALQPVPPGKRGFAGKPRVVSTSPHISEEKGSSAFMSTGVLKRREKVINGHRT